MNNEVVLSFSNAAITFYEGEDLEVSSKKAIKERIVSYDNFIDILNASTKIMLNNSGEKNVLPAGTVFFDYGSNDANTGVDIDKKIIGILVTKKRVVLLFNDKPLEVAIPNLLFTFNINKGKYSTAVNIVLDEDILRTTFIDNVSLKNDFSIYPTVFPNSYSDGRVCWGNAQLPKVIVCSQDYYDVINTFFLSGFNNDLLSTDRIDIEYLLDTYHSDIDRNKIKNKAAMYELFLQTMSRLDSFDDKLVNKNILK